MRLFYVSSVFFVTLFVAGCTTHTLKSQQPNYISQDATHYIKDFDANISLSLEEYKKRYFSPWYLEKPTKTLKEVSWAYLRYKDRVNYGSNLSVLEKDFLEKLQKKSNLEEYGKLNKIAITLDELNIRALPTSQPLFADPTQAGEGYPFDYLQNSTVHQNKPIFVTHYSKDREWVHIETSFTYGWVKRKDIKFISKQQRDFFVKRSIGFVQKEGVAFYDTQNNFLGKTKFAMLLPIVAEDKDSYSVVVADRVHQEFVKTRLAKDVLHKNPLVFNRDNIVKIVTSLESSKYGWGGMNEQRDCSSTLRDFYAPFGFWLPRNSSVQGRVGKVFSLKGLTQEERYKLIEQKAVPFRTLLYKHGHILLYVGMQDGKIIVFQNMWGIRTLKDGKSGRYIIGKALFSDLEFGSNIENYDSRKKMIEKLQSFNILF